MNCHSVNSLCERTFFIFDKGQFSSGKIFLNQEALEHKHSLRFHPGSRKRCTVCIELYLGKARNGRVEKGKVIRLQIFIVLGSLWHLMKRDARGSEMQIRLA